MERPKSDLASLATLGVGVYGTIKVGRMESAFRDFAVAQQEAHSQTMRGLQTISELQVATMYMIRDLNEELSKLSEIGGDILEIIQRKEQREDMIGDLRLRIRSIDKALDEIDHQAETHLEWATVQVEIVQALVEYHDVRIEHFKHSHADMDRAEEVLERLASTHRDFLRQLGDE